VSDTGNDRIVSQIHPLLAASTFAGTGVAGFSGDGGPASQAQLSAPGGFARTAGGLYIADTGNNRVRLVGQDSVIRTFAGNGTAGFSGDGGPAAQAALDAPLDVALAADGVTLYIADTGNNRVRKVAPDGTITTVAGNGTAGFSGDGGAATQAQLDTPSGVALDPAGNLYIADTASHRVRKVTPDGTITTIAGSDTTTAVGDGGPAGQARLVSPWGLAADQFGDLYIADQGDDRIREIANGRPTAVPTVSVQRAAAPVEVTFDASGSNDPDGRIASYSWSIGASGSGISLGTATTSSSTQVLTQPGTYDATLTVTDDAGAPSPPATVRVVVDPEVAAGGLVLSSVQITGGWRASRLMNGDLFIAGAVVRAADLDLEILRRGRGVSLTRFSTTAGGPFTHVVKLSARMLPGIYTVRLSQRGDRAMAPLPVREAQVRLGAPAEGVASEAALGRIPHALVARIALAALPRAGRALVVSWFGPGSRRPLAVHRVGRRALLIDRLHLAPRVKSGTWRAELRWGSRLVASASTRISGRAR